MRILLLLFLLIISLFRYINEMYTEQSKESLFITCLTLLISLVVSLTKKEKLYVLKNNLFKISTFILISIVIVHFFEYLAFIIGVKDSIIGIEFISTKYINEAAINSLCCTIVILLGYLIQSSSPKNNKIGPSYTIDNHSIGRMRIPEYLMAISIIVFYVFTDKKYFQGGYGEAMNSTGLSLVSYLSQSFIWASQLAAVIIKIYSCADKRISLKKYIFKYSILFYISLFFYYILVFSSGDRGPLIYMTIAWCSGYIIINKIKIKKHVFITLIIIAAMMLSFMGTLRSFKGDISIEKIEEVSSYRKQAYDDQNGIFTYTKDLSNVVRAYHVLYYNKDIYKDDNYLWGIGILDQILGIVPGLRYFLYPILGIDTVTTAELSTIFLNSDHGMGTTCFADIYFSVGFIGSLIFFFMFGIVLRKMDVALYYNNTSSIWFFVLSMSYLSMSIYIGRSSCFSPINMFAYSYIILRFFCKIK